MAQEAPNEVGSLRSGDLKIYQTIIGVSEVPVVEIVIPCKESGAPQGMQERDDFVSILHSQLTDFNADLSNVNPPSFKPLPLWFIDVFIKHDHAARQRFTVFVVRASLARLIASPIASRVILPR